MRRFYNNGTSFIEAVTKGTPAGAIGSIVKKIVKAKKDKESRNPDPKTPKMMGTKKEKEISFTSSERREPKKKKFGKKNMDDMMIRYPKGKELDPETTKKIKKLKAFKKG